MLRMPMHAAARARSYRHHLRKKLLAKGSSPNNKKFVVLPSASDIVVDDGIQVSSSSLEPIPSSQQHHHHHPHYPPTSTKTFGILPLLPLTLNSRSSALSKKSRSYLPNVVKMPPEEIREAFLNQGTTYWKIVLHASTILGLATIIQLVIYFLVFGLQGHYRIIVGLLPARDAVVFWFLSLNIVDLLVPFILRFGKYLSNRFDMGKDVDARFIGLATAILILNFISSMAFPVYATPNLMANVNGTIEQNSTLCLEPRNTFNELGTGWDVIPTLKNMCSKHILCIEQCRDFRTLFLWIYGCYLLSIVRLFVLITIWNTVSFLCMVKDLREDVIGYQISLVDD